MTLPITVTILALWSVVMWRYARSVLFPPAALAMVWTFTLLVIWLCGDIYYPLTTVANEIVLVGVGAFSLGGFVAVFLPIPRGRVLADLSHARRRHVDVGLSLAL